jgi:chromosomal replication initiation ATPase DnaA
MLVQVSTPTSAAELRALYRRTRAHFALAPPPAAAAKPAGAAVPTEPPQARFSGRAALRVVARHFGLSPAAVAGITRLRRVVVARWVVMHICVEAGGYTAARAGRLLGRDHTTVLYGLRELASLVARDPALAEEIARLTWQCMPEATR